MTESPLNIKLDAFEGPLDLLLHLIKENKVDIFDIPITIITNQYLEYLKAMKELDLELSGEFLVMAATLLYIKSKMLLPVEPSDEEEDSGVDPRDELVKKLLEYQSFKEAAKELGLLAQERSRVYTRSVMEDFSRFITFDNTEAEFGVNLGDLINAFSRVLKQMRKETFHEVYEESISIEQMVDEIKNIIEVNDSVPFISLFIKRKSRNALIATFFAILELAKGRVIRIVQDSMFGDIILTKVT